MKKFLKVLMYVSVISIIITTILFKLVLPSQLQLADRVEKICGDCEFSSENTQIKLLPLRLILSGVHFANGSPKNTAIDAKIDKITLTISAGALTDHRIKITHIAIESPTVVVTEGDSKLPASAKSDSESDWGFEIDRTKLNNANFIYKRIHNGAVGTIQVSKIYGEVSEIGTSIARRNLPTTARINAQLEDSGKFDLTVSSIIFSKKINVDVALDMKDLNLANVNRYFIPIDGITMNGQLNRGLCKVSVRDSVIQSQLNADYQGLNLNFEKTFERSEFTSIVANLFSGIKQTKDRSRRATIARELQEPLIGFILRGMKEAGMKVATDK